ncbi:MAG: hypothetical protein M3N51_04135, partial [Actinomycetota bacterium]|nr:hypothetical protein [Actinomycetota bacterium]
MTRRKGRAARRPIGLATLGMLTALLAAVATLPVAAQTSDQVTERVSVASNGGQGDGISVDAAISADGRYVAFDSTASNLVGGDTNGAIDVFVRDRVSGTTERVSLASNEAQGNGHSGDPDISADGRYVAFGSSAPNLVVNDFNGEGDVFVRDRSRGATERVSVAPDGTSGNDYSFPGVISADGRYVAFWSIASNLVPGDTNGAGDVFVRDRVTGTTELVSVAKGTQGNGASYGPAISAGGRYVGFESDASNLVEGDTNA